jgi:hypothetical protein
MHDADGWPPPNEIERLQATLGDSQRPGAVNSPKLVAREARRPLVAASFDATQVEAALDLIETVELAWPAVYGATMPERIVRDLLDSSSGNLVDCARMVRLALTDWRDVAANADRSRARRPG